MSVPADKLAELDAITEESYAPAEGFAIDTLDLAVWADEKVHDAEVKIAEIETLANERIQVLQSKIDKLNDWKTDAQDPYVRTIEFFKPRLLAYLAAEIDKQIKAKAKKISKSIKLPYRNLVSRSQQPSVERNEDLLLKWAEENAPEFVERKSSVKWGALKETLKQVNIDGELVYVDANGVKVEGVTLIDKGEVYDWKLKE